MRPSRTSTIVLIIPLILRALCSPQTRAVAFDTAAIPPFGFERDQQYRRPFSHIQYMDCPDHWEPLLQLMPGRGCLVKVNIPAYMDYFILNGTSYLPPGIRWGSNLTTTVIRDPFTVCPPCYHFPKHQFSNTASVAQPRKLLPQGDKDDAKKPRFHRRLRIMGNKEHIISVSIALLGLLCTIIAGLVLWCKRKKLKRVPHTDLCLSIPRRYHRTEMVMVEEIGKGGFGTVYRGYLNDHDGHVAIKMRSGESSARGRHEFEAEVRTMTRLRHRNIVQLLGWCDDPGSDHMLVYEFMSNGSLDKHLHDPERLLTWPDRYKIILDLGSAILYLHTECEQCVVHGDIKPANIMLDPSVNAKLGDFGQARLVDHEADSLTTQVVTGTAGYIDPEFVNSQRPSPESDVYSFGVVLLEIASGQRPTSTVVVQENDGTSVLLLSWVRDMYRRDMILGTADRRLEGEFHERQMMRVLVTGLWCAHSNRSRRPSIADAMDVLRRDDGVLPALDLVIDNRTPHSVRSLEERAYRDLSAEDSSASADTSTETAYYTSKGIQPVF